LLHLPSEVAEPLIIITMAGNASVFLV